MSKTQMTKQQRDYALTRVREIFNKRLKELTDENSFPPVQMTDAERFSLIESGEVRLRKVISSYIRETLFSSYDWPPAWAYKTIIDHEAMATEKANMVKKLQQLEDTIMLGDAAEALALIQEYED